MLFVVSALLANVLSVPSLLLPKHPSTSTLYLRAIDFYASLTRARFEELFQDLLRTTFDPVEKVLWEDSKIDKSNVHEIVLGGGSTRIPRIVKLVSDFFHSKVPNKIIQPWWRGRLMVLQSKPPSSPGYLWEDPGSSFSWHCLFPSVSSVMTAFMKRNTTVPTKKSEFSLPTLTTNPLCLCKHTKECVL